MKEPTFTEVFIILHQEQELNLATEKLNFWTESFVFHNKNKNTANTIQFLPPIQTDTLTFVLPECFLSVLTIS